MLKNAILTFLIIIACNANAQEPETKHHEHHRNEFGIGNSPVYFLNEGEFAYGFHIHYIRIIPDTRFGLGLSYERIFDDHKHNSTGLVLSYAPVEKINLSIAPGIAFEDGSDSYNWAMHFETSYDFEIHDFHLGPIIELALDKEDVHISIGLHIGIGF